jgi:hypothetical protein
VVQSRHPDEKKQYVVSLDSFQTRHPLGKLLYSCHSFIPIFVAHASFLRQGGISHSFWTSAILCNEVISQELNALATSRIDNELWCFDNGTWKVNTISPMSIHERISIDQAIQAHTPLYTALAQLVTGYLHGYVSSEQWMSRTGKRKHNDIPSTPPPAHITTLGVKWRMSQHDHVTGPFVEYGRDLFGAKVDVHAHPSPLTFKTTEIDAWLADNGVIGANAFMWFASLGAWFDVGCTPERRLRMDMMPVWVNADSDFVECILRCLQNWSCISTSTYDPFKQHTASVNSAWSWACDWNSMHSATENADKLIEMLNGHVGLMPRLYRYPLENVSVDARGIMYTQKSRWAVSPRSINTACAIRRLAPRSLVFDLSCTSLSTRSAPIHQAHLVRKAILCWRALLYQLEERDTCMSRALPNTVAAAYFHSQCNQLFGLEE